MTLQTPAWPHGEIKQIFDDIFFVSGINKTVHDGVELQHSRNMIIVREEGKLSLINSVRLTDIGLIALEKLGQVDKVISIGAFHGRDDAFYVNKYQAALWALPGMQNQHGCRIDVVFTAQGQQPFANCSLLIYATANFPEAVIYIKQHDGILLSCDSIKNWLSADEYFSEQTAATYKEQVFFGKATISKIWQQAMAVKASDFERLKQLSFRHLLSAHGEPLLNTAYQDVLDTIKQEYGV
ncbi:hypothetical protein Megvenef_00484 [Candidatus Megaera venefica]|uniref:Uncharacterized protein n=1 Tax=Candidatus Megaera venefica TaxID=2055910 RepID=A0ABU5NBG3_9RICK|nr:hypothetical protein [Candidatus Megaera venefica]MEA0970518.1 hypothetical protein [Candidatus Megaera venefica]